MDADALLDDWRRLLPPSVSVSAGSFSTEAPPLSELERRSAGDVDAGRLRELENGRWFAKRALGGLGVGATDLPVGPDRAPRWPNGIVGSLTHAGSIVAVAVARSKDVSALGIDLEIEGGLDPEILCRFLTRREQGQLLPAPPPQRFFDARHLWCIKEAAIKAAGGRVDPLDIEVEADSQAGGVRTWRIRMAGGRPVWSGRSGRSGGFVLAAVAIESSGR